VSGGRAGRRASDEQRRRTERAEQRKRLGRTEEFLADSKGEDSYGKHGDGERERSESSGTNTATSEASEECSEPRESSRPRASEAFAVQQSPRATDTTN
jgi:hypothetical protein